MSEKITFDNEEEYDSMLDALGQCQIFTITKMKNGKFEIREECDGWYFITVTKEQLLILANEIKALAD